MYVKLDLLRRCCSFLIPLSKTNCIFKDAKINKYMPSVPKQLVFDRSHKMTTLPDDVKNASFERDKKRGINWFQHTFFLSVKCLKSRHAYATYSIIFHFDFHEVAQIA